MFAVCGFGLAVLRPQQPRLQERRCHNHASPAGMAMMLRRTPFPDLVSCVPRIVPAPGLPIDHEGIFISTPSARHMAVDSPLSAQYASAEYAWNDLAKSRWPTTDFERPE